MYDPERFSVHVQHVHLCPEGDSNMRKSIKTGLVGASVLALGLGLTGTAHADVQPRGTDVVGVGSDTVQYIADFVNDGDNAGNAGYNSLNTSRRVFSFDATSDAGGRAAYSKNYTTNASVDYQPSVVLRAGSAPVVRPNGSGAGLAALIADATHTIDFVRASRAPKGTEQTAATAAAGVGVLHSYQIATDGMQMAVSNSVVSNAPGGAAPTAISCLDIVKIYSGTILTWNQITGNSAGSTATIVPLIPQAGSGTRGDFESTIKACNATVAVPLTNPNLVTVEEHDEGPIKSNANAIGPFSVGRKTLIDSGYLALGTAGQPINGVALVPSSLSTGTASSTAAQDFFVARKFYIVVRDSDVTSTKPMQLGSTLNFVNTLFGTNTSEYAKSARSANFTSAGVTQAWANFGTASVG